MLWDNLPLARAIMVFVALGFLMIFIQVTLLHHRQNFRFWQQWIPVVALPLLALVSLALGWANLEWLRTLVAVALIVGLIAGVYGFSLHLVGVGKRVDGYRYHNFLVGPPIILPLMISAMSVLGLLALYWS